MNHSLCRHIFHFLFFMYSWFSLYRYFFMYSWFSLYLICPVKQSWSYLGPHQWSPFVTEVTLWHHFFFVLKLSKDSTVDLLYQTNFSSLPLNPYLYIPLITLSVITYNKQHCFQVKKEQDCNLCEPQQSWSPSMFLGLTVHYRDSISCNKWQRYYYWL